METKLNQIKVVEAQLLTAMKNADIEQLNALLHDDLLFNIPGGQTFTKSMDMASYQSGEMQIDELVTGDVQVRDMENTVVVVTTIHMKGQYKDYKINDNYRFLRVWKLFGTQWKVIAGSSNPIVS